MATGYRSPITAIQEVSEDEQGQLKSQDDSSAPEKSHRRSKASHEKKMPTTKANISKERERERERPKRYHKSALFGIGGGNRHTSSQKSKKTSAKRESVAREKESELEHERRSRHLRSHSNRSRDGSSSSSTSSSKDEAPTQGNMPLLSSARAKLTSPSTISTISNITSLTSTTNKSSSSSGSNSTVTLSSSITKRYYVEKRAFVDKKSDLPEAPVSPAVPDAPNVFAYLVSESSVAESRDEEESSGIDATPTWTSGQLPRTTTESSLPTHMSQSLIGSSSSASSFHGDDNSSEAAHDEDTDRSTSPERSMDGEEGEYDEEEDERDDPEVESASNDDTSAKIASQMAAAQNYQQIYNFGTPNMQSGHANIPHTSSTGLNARSQQPTQHPPRRAERLSMTGYELLASRLSSRATSSETERGEKIKPIYRIFEFLNHRLLLHIQDELSVLEQQLHRLDRADIIPASRRKSAAAGGELELQKQEILWKISYKLSQYNQVLASFNSVRSLPAASPKDIASYRTWLQNFHPITKAETHFLDREDDLVTIVSEQSSAHPEDVDSKQKLKPIPVIAGSLAVCVLVPMLTFAVIPGFLYRITATGLVVGGVLALLMQGGVLERRMLLKNDGLICAGIYGAVMIVLAGLFRV